MRAFDISEHYRAELAGHRLQGAAGRAQQGGGAELQGISGRARRGHQRGDHLAARRARRLDEVDDEESTDEVVAFWQRMMKRYGIEEEYNKQIVNAFKFGDEPEILIVVDKLLTGFDAPRNTVLYLARQLKEHTLLQAIARVNRLYEDDRAARPRTSATSSTTGRAGRAGPGADHLQRLGRIRGGRPDGALTSIDEEMQSLPQRHAELWDLFKTVKNRQDEEAFEQLLADEKLRDDFYERLSAYAKTLAIALSSERFITDDAGAEASSLQERPQALHQSEGGGEAALCRVNRLPRLRAADPEAAGHAHLGHRGGAAERAGEHLRRGRVPEGGRGARPGARRPPPRPT